MEIACPKKIVSNIPVLASGYFMRSVYLTQYSASQELFIKTHGKVVPKRLHYRRFPQNPSPVEKKEDNYMLTWNSGYINK